MAGIMAAAAIRVYMTAGVAGGWTDGRMKKDLRSNKMTGNVPTRTPHPDVRIRAGARAGLVGLICNIVLFAMKFALGVLSGSVAILSDAFNNLTDAISAIAMYAGFVISGRAPDAGHPFGHGRMEYISGLIVSLLVVATGVGVGKTSLEHLWSGGTVELGAYVLPALAASIIVKLAMAVYYRRVDAQIDSAVLRAGVADSLSDAATTGVALVALSLAPYTALPLDGIIGLGVAAMIVRAGVKSMRETIIPLLGVSPDPVLVDELTRTVLAVSGIQGIHGLIVNDYGPSCKIATAHVEITDEMTFTEAAMLAGVATAKVQRELGIEITLHIDPVEVMQRQVV